MSSVTYVLAQRGIKTKEEAERYIHNLYVERVNHIASMLGVIATCLYDCKPLGNMINVLWL
ncbi:hypothetical protein AAFX24_28660 [Vibrio mediterranei]|uniref:hypothetical protein n=1 Tax=Vibrio mediterranei TaxID=689 RepID=UPI0038CE6A7F